jgi:osmotically-inducible protein OsmY
MKKLIFLPLFAVVLSSGVMGCEPRSSERGTAESKTAVSNSSDVEKSIKAILEADDQLRTAKISVTADADKKEATLSGTVESEALRSKAIELAKSAQPGLTVNDKIDVKPLEIARTDFTEDLAKKELEKAKQAGEKLGGTIEDAWLHGKILAKLVGNEKTPARNINVDVVKGVVTLRGSVSDAEQKSEAEKLAKETEGVKSVKNQLKVNA